MYSRGAERCRIPMLRLHSTAHTIPLSSIVHFTYSFPNKFTWRHTVQRSFTTALCVPVPRQPVNDAGATEGCSCSLTSWSTPLRYSRTPLCPSSIADVTSSVPIIPFLGSNTHRGDLWCERIICARIIHLFLNDRKYYEPHT